MPNVDERIVEMRFDNKDFESNVGVSLDTLDKLKKALNLDGAVHSLNEIEKTTKSFSLVGISSAVDAVTEHFSSLGIIGDQVLRRIGDAVYDLEMRFINLIKSMSTDQITEGFDKYERKTKAVQTIMNATGLSIDAVSASLDKLNWFTDETSYSYESMVDNIGKFTSSNIDLDVAITSMIGIADAAGLAGASVTDASHAMDGFSKAIAQGYMTRQNWQWIRTAHMDTAQFKTTLIETAESLGTLKRAGDNVWSTLDGTTVSVADFETALKDGWMTTEVMNGALAKFGSTTEDIYTEYLRTGDLTSDIIARMAIATDDLGLKAFKASQEARTFTDAIESVKDAVSTGWMVSFEYIFGNYEEAVSLWTTVANELWDVFNGGAEARNEMLKGWHEGADGVSGYSMALEALSNIWSGLISILHAVQDAWKSVFPSMTSERLIEITESIRDWSEGFAGAWKYVEDTEGAIDNFIRPFREAVGLATETTEETAEASANLDELARRVIRGEFGNGAERQEALESLGLSYEKIQNRVNELLGSNYRLEESTDGVTEALEDTADASDTAREHSSGIFKKPGEDAEKSSNNIENLMRIIRGIASAIDIIKQATSAFWTVILKPALSGAAKLLSPILNFLGNIGDKITNLASKWREENFFTNLFQGFVDKLVAAKDKVKEFVDRAKKLESVQKLLGYLIKLRDWFTSKKNEAVSKFSDFFKNLKIPLPSMEQLLKVLDWIVSKVNKVVESLKPLAKGLLDRIKNFIDNIRNTDKNAFGDFFSVDTITNNLSILKDKLIAFKDTVFSLFNKDSSKNSDQSNGIIGFLKRIGSAIWDFLKTVSPTNILLLAFAVTFISAIVAIRKALNAVTGVVKSVGGILTAIKERIQPKQPSTILQIAIALGILAAALIALTLVDQDKLKYAAKVMLGIMGALTIMIIVVSVLSVIMSKMKIVQTGASTMLGFSGSILMLVVALRLLDGLEMEGIWKKLGVLGLIMLALIGASIIMAKAAPQLSKGSIFLVSFAAAMLLIVLSLRLLANLDLSGVNENLGAFAMVLGAMVALSIVAKNAKFSGALGIAVLCLDLLLLAKVLEKLAKTDPASVLKGLPMFVLIFALLNAMMKSTKSAGENALKGGAGILLMSLALILIADTIKKLGNLDLKTAAQGTAAVALILAMFRFLLAGMKNISKDAAKAGVSILIMSGAILILALAIDYLGNLDFKTAAQGTLVVIILLGMIALVLKASQGVQKATGAMIAIAALIAIITGAILLLSFIPFTDALAYAGSLSIVLLAVSGALSILSKTKTNFKAVLLQVVQIALILGMLAGVFYLMRDLNGNRVVRQAAGMAIACLSIAAVIKILSTLPKGGFGKVAAGMGSFLLVVAALVGIVVGLGALMSIDGFDALISDGSKLLQVMDTLVPIFLKMAAITGAMALIGLGGWAGLTGVVTFTALIVAIGGILVGLGALAEKAKGASWIDSGAEIFNKIGNAIGSFLGSIVSGLIGVVVGDISSVAQSIVDFVTAFDDIDDDTVTSATNAATALASFAAALPRSGGALQVLIGEKDVGKFGSDLVTLGAGLKSFSDTITADGGIDAEAITSSANAALALASLYDNLPRSGGKLQSFIGEENLATFGGQLVSLGEGLRAYNDTITANGGIDSTAISSSANAALALSALYDNLPASNGVLQKFIGEKDLGTFGDQLVPLAEGLVAYSSAITAEGAVDSTAVESSANLLSMFVALNNDLPAIDGVLQWFTGEKDLGTFGDNLAQLGEGLVGFSDSTSSLGNSEYVSLYRAVGIVSSIVGISQALADATAETGNINFLGDVASLLDTIGINIGSLWTSVEPIDFTQIDSLTSFLGSFNDAEFISEAPDLTAIENVLKAIYPNITSEVSWIYNAISAISDWDAILSFIEFLVSVSEACDGFPTSEVDTSHLQSALDGIANVSVDSFSQTFTDGTSTVTDAINNLLNAAADAIQSGNTREFYQAGYNLIQQIANGMRSYGGLTSIARSVASTISTTIRNNINGYSIGTNAMAGFINGMNAKAPEVYDTARRIANNVSTTMKKALDEHSPSRVTYGIGRFVSEGLSLGISDYGTMVERSAENVSDAAVDQMRNAIQTVSDIVNGIVELDPTIRPVLDLSNIQNGAQAINSLLGLNTTQFNLDSLAANAASINGAFRAQSAAAAVTQTSQQDVVSAIRGIRSDINELGERITSMQLVLDSGTLVGEIINPIDQELGRRQLYAERGV